MDNPEMMIRKYRLVDEPDGEQVHNVIRSADGEITTTTLFAEAGESNGFSWLGTPAEFEQQFFPI